MQESLSPVLILSVAGIVLSLGFSYVPKLRTWFAKLGADDPEDGGTRKRLVMLGLLVVVWAAMIGLDYFGFVVFGLAYDKQGWAVTVGALISALVSNQSAYSISPKTKDVKALRGK